MNKTFTFEVTETLTRRVIVQASSKEEAEMNVVEQYRNEEIILGSEDYVCTHIKCVDV